MFEQNVCNLDEAVFREKILELRSRVEPHLVPVLQSFESNVPLDLKQKIEDSFEGPLFHELLTFCDKK